MAKDTKRVCGFQWFKRAHGFQEIYFLLATVGLFSPLTISRPNCTRHSHIFLAVTQQLHGMFFTSEKQHVGDRSLPLSPELNQTLHNFKWMSPTVAMWLRGKQVKSGKKLVRLAVASFLGLLALTWSKASY